MKPLFRAIAYLVATTFSSGEATAQEAPTPEPQKLDAEEFARRVEQEFEKLDPALIQDIQLDYTEGAEQTKPVRLAVIGDAENEIRARFRVRADGTYNSLTDVLSLQINEGGINCIPHELWHRVYDSLGNKGLFHQEGYAGPSVEDITAFATTLTDTPAFDEVRKNIAIRNAAGEIALTGELLAEERSRLEGIREEWNTVLKTFDLNKRYVDFIPEDLENALKHEGNVLADQKEGLLQAHQAITDYCNTHIEPLRGKEIDDPETILEHARAIRALYETLITYDSLHLELPLYVDKLSDAFKDAREKSKEERMRALEERLANTTDAREKRSLERELASQKRMAELSSAFDFDFGTTELMNTIETETITKYRAMLEEMYGKTAEKVDQVLSSPDEVMGRVVDSLYSLHHGPVQQNYYPLSQRELDFLGQFTFQGEQIFKKGIERYQVFLGLMKDGVSPEEARAQVRNAQTFEYKGTTYHWLPARAELRGTIPEGR